MKTEHDYLMICIPYSGGPVIETEHRGSSSWQYSFTYNFWGPSGKQWGIKISHNSFLRLHLRFIIPNFPYFPHYIICLYAVYMSRAVRYTSKHNGVGTLVHYIENKDFLIIKSFLSLKSHLQSKVILQIRNTNLFKELTFTFVKSCNLCLQKYCQNFRTRILDFLNRLCLVCNAWLVP